jgi:type II secretory pathway component PulF
LATLIPAIVQYYAFLDMLGKAIIKQLTYPLITIVVAVCVVTGFYFFIYPLLASIVPHTASNHSWLSITVGIVSCGSVGLYYKPIMRHLIQATGLPILFRKLHIILLMQLAPDRLTLIDMLKRYAPDGTLARICFQLHKGLAFEHVLRGLTFTAHELLLVSQAERTGERQYYNRVEKMICESIENRVQALTQCIEPFLTVCTGLLVGGCVYTMLVPVLQLQAGINF